ncbi:MAG: glycosyltransferase family 2 protein, partial [Bacteroidota bacterium]
MPEISICIPSYNQSEFVRRALDSLVPQTFIDFEVVVTDDSPDSLTEQVCSYYKDKFKIHYFKNSSTLGSPENWNESIRKANGKWIKILHHDDWFNDSDGLSKFHQLTMENPTVSFHFCTTRILNHVSGEVTFNQPSEIQLNLLSKRPNELLYGNFIGPPSSTLFRKDTKFFFDKNIKYVVDIDFYVRLLSTFPGFGFCSEPLINNTSSHPDQVTSASLNRKTQLWEY